MTATGHDSSTGDETCNNPDCNNGKVLRFYHRGDAIYTEYEEWWEPCPSCSGKKDQEQVRRNRRLNAIPGEAPREINMTKLGDLNITPAEFDELARAEGYARVHFTVEPPAINPMLPHETGIVVRSVGDGQVIAIPDETLVALGYERRDSKDG